MIDTKEYAALQEECERLRAENQRLNKCLARYRAKYGEKGSAAAMWLPYSGSRPFIPEGVSTMKRRV